MKHFTKKLLFIALLFDLQISCMAQILTPTFEMPLYFEDAHGNKDTLIVGYDRDALYDQLNLQFGEVAISTPFDSVLDVRAFHRDDNSQTLTKKIIAWAEGQTCDLFAFNPIIVRAKYLPLTVRYDSMLLNSSAACPNIILARLGDLFNIPEWYEATGYYCMNQTNTIVIPNFTDQPPLPAPDFQTSPFEVLGEGIVNIPAMTWVNFNYGPCSPYVVSTNAAIQPKIIPVQVIPNPTQSSSRVVVGSSGDYASSVTLFSAIGQVVSVQSVRLTSGENTLDLNIRDISSGVWYVRVSNEAGAGVARFVKP
jgi:hypothetical protein